MQCLLSTGSILMKRTKGPWLVEETVQRYQSSRLEVYEDIVIAPNGQSGTFATATMKPGVSVLALDDQVYLTREFRYAIERESIEVVSGEIDDDELALSAARRELREELGIEASEWIGRGYACIVDSFRAARGGRAP